MGKEWATIEQAIFTSAKTENSAGYQILAASPGIVEHDRRELVAWGPSHDSLSDAGPDAESVNFFPLPSGSFCLSRTIAAGWEYSGRGGRRIYTHCLVVSSAVLRQFANHPLELLDAVTARHSPDALASIPACLEPLQLRTNAAARDPRLLSQLAAEVGPAALAMLVQGVLTHVGLAVRGPVTTQRLIGGLLDCLPLDCRGSISFSTGLKFSARRPFDLFALPDDAAAQRWLAHRTGLTALDLGNGQVSDRLLVNDWARLVYRALSSGNVAFLAEELARPRADFTLVDLPLLGLQLLDELDAGGMRQPQAVAMRQSHAAHRKFQGSLAATSTCETPAARGPAKFLDTDSPEVVARLEALDDALFDAVQGKAAALAEFRKLWPALKVELGEALLAESREQYIRYALSIWREPVNIAGDHDPVRAIHALEVLCVLFDEVN
jgi:hypothetical protein